MSFALSRSVVDCCRRLEPLLGPGTVPIMCPLRHIKSRWERAPRNKREIKGQFETRLKRGLVDSVTPAKSMQLVRGIMLCKRTERERREEGESPKNQNSADDQKDKLHPVGRQGAGRDRDLHFRGERPSDGESRNDDEESSAQHRQGQCQVEE